MTIIASAAVGALCVIAFSLIRIGDALYEIAREIKEQP